MDRITKSNLQARVKDINCILEELGVNIDASISGANGGWSLVGNKGSHNLSRTGHIPKRELYDQMTTVIEILYEVSRQQRGNCSFHHLNNKEMVTAIENDWVKEYEKPATIHLS